MVSFDPQWLMWMSVWRVSGKPGITGCMYIVVDWTFTSAGVDLHTHLFIIHRCVSFTCLIFVVGLDHKNYFILTAIDFLF